MHSCQPLMPSHLHFSGALVTVHALLAAGTVFKRFDATKLFALTCQDVVERFHLVLALAFVLAEEMVSAGRVWPNGHLLWQSAYILGAEVAIDVLKHAVLGRFNEIRPGVYREFTVVRLLAFPKCLPCLHLHQRQ